MSVSISYADVDDNSSDLNALKSRISDVQWTQAWLPSGVAEPKWKIGFILSKMFNADGQIPNIVLKLFNGTSRTNNNVLKWTWGNGGAFAQSLIYDDGSTVWIGSLPDTASLELDVAGSVGATQYCDGSGNNCFDPAAVSVSGSAIGGGGTSWYTARFTGTGFTISDWVIRDNGSNVGIGTAPTGDRLTTNGTINVIWAGGIAVDGNVAISNTNASHTARYTWDNHYGYFEVRRASWDRGAFFWWGDGADEVNLNLDAADTLAIEGWSDASIAGGGYVVIGDTTATNVAIDNNEIMARNNWANSTLNFQLDGWSTTIWWNFTHASDSHNTDFVVRDADKGTVSNVIWYDYSSGVTYLGNTGGPWTSAEVQIRWQAQLNEEWTAGNHLVTKAYVDTAAAAGSSLWTEDGTNVYRSTGNVAIRSTSDASLTSTAHALTLWSASGLNIVADNNEIMALNNGAVSSLHLNTEGGDLFVHNNEPESTKFVVKNDGKVGVGITAPATKLDVAWDIRGSSVATNCVGNCTTATPPPTGNYVVVGDLDVSGNISAANFDPNNVTGNLNVSGNLSAANFYDQTPILGYSNKASTNNYVSNASGWSATNRITRIDITVPAWPSRKYRLSGRAMKLGSNKYGLIRIIKSDGAAVIGAWAAYEYSWWHGGWEMIYLEGYVSLSPGTHTYYIEAYGGGSYASRWHTNAAYSQIIAWPLQWW